MTNLPKRLDLDLKFRIPRKLVLLFDEELLILTEPDFEHIEFVASIEHPHIHHARGLLQYIRFELDELKDLLEFVNTLPFYILTSLETLCGIYFEQDVSIENRILGYANPVDLNGYLKAEAVHSKELKQRQVYDLLFNRLFEGLGVHIRAKPPSEALEEATVQDEDVTRDFAWIPLVQAINPKAYESVKGGLTYIPKDGEDDLTRLENILNESERLEAAAEKLRNPTAEGLEEELKKAEKKGRLPLSLVTSRADYIKAIHQFAKFGYLEVSSKMDTHEYQRMVMEGRPEVSKDREKFKVETKKAEDDQINIKSRWKGLKKTQRKLEGLE